MQIEKIISLPFLTRNVWARAIVPGAAFLLVEVSLFVVFAVVPTEQVMGPVQRIFYFHVGAAMSAYLMIAVLFVASLFYLATRKAEWEILGRASAWMGLMLCSIVLVSGMIWGHSAWNTWWRWEPRLVSFLILWLFLLSYNILFSFVQGDQRQGNYGAVLGILIAVNVPIVILSIKFLDHTQQLHPQVIASQGLASPWFVNGLILAMVSLMIFSIWVLALKIAALLLEEKLQLIERKTGMLR